MSSCEALMDDSITSNMFTNVQNLVTLIGQRIASDKVVDWDIKA